MAPRRKTGKPQQLVEAEHEEEATSHAPALAQETSLDEFLRNVHGQSLEGVKASTVPTGEGLPSLIWLKERFKTKSAAIRYLVLDRKFSVAIVAKHLGLKYQHVRNVSHQELKRGPNEQFHLGEEQATNFAKSVENPSISVEKSAKSVENSEE